MSNTKGNIKNFKSFQLVNKNTGERVNSKAKPVRQVLFNQHGRFFTEGAAKTFKLNVLKATAKEFGGLKYLPREIKEATEAYLNQLVIVEVEVKMLVVSNDFVSLGE